ncbi:putative kynurenine 3-monooxygenase [Trichodelitschia bisporula]|uniref:Kynurenine 3-monooxygenase n=1 Tax=Trichodelitschia bisporula TaxID=703511 RepID=A0A6G1I424_9PEZI|nr:putative kynurenine 3-monooxygenase [Trichodelitschia bisporula]
MVSQKKTIVVGAGPVGSLAALYAANRGDDVEVYELRGDPRDPSTVPLNFTKSINLALSERGINAMRNAAHPGLLDAVLAETIPMHSRMIHGQEGGQLLEEAQAYDVHGRLLRAVDRAGLSKCLLDELDRMPNIKFFFNHKLVGADFRRKLAWFERKIPKSQDLLSNPSQPGSGTEKNELEVSFDFMIGADGAHSAVRYHLMKYTRMSYQQEYIDALWCEFQISPAKTTNGDDFKISPNHFHIWPGGDFMFIAIPSLDKTFTSTLFLPQAKFDELDGTPDVLVPFFKANFPGVVPDLISEIELQNQYQNNPHLPLISIKCNPYHFGSSVVILGDAAHAMVPFYGQGMNAGMEDVRILFEHLDKYNPSTQPGQIRDHLLTKALEEYTETRRPDAAAINDMAIRNYQEMRSDVRSPTYKLRKAIEEFLYARFPTLGWATQYSRVSFSNERYSEVVKKSQRQKKILLTLFGTILVSGLSGGVWWALSAHPAARIVRLITGWLRPFRRT